MGKHGGAVALWTPAGVETKFFEGHTEQTQYEIGSVTKTMVAYLLAELIAQGELNQAQQATRIWPAVPKDIRLIDLATHTSGLPRLPDDLFVEADSTNPYAHYQQAHLEKALESLATQGALRAAGAEYEYSNFGYGLLAELMGMQAGTSFSSLLEQKLFKPAGMGNSRVALTSQVANSQLEPGHDLWGEPVPTWQFEALAGAGAVTSTLDDMLSYVRFLIDLTQANHPITELLFAPQLELNAHTQQALGWIIQTDKTGKKFAWHNGQTAGYASFVGFYLDGSRAVVVLNQQAYDFSAEAIELLTQSEVRLNE